MFQRNGKHYLVSRPPTRIGAAIDNSNICSFDPNLLAYSADNPIVDISGDKGIECYTSGDVFSFTEFQKYYKKGETFDTQIIHGWDDIDDMGCLIFACAFANEIMGCLMTEHGVSYEAARLMVPGLICPDGFYNFIKLEKTRFNMHKHIGGLLNGEVESLIDQKITKLIRRACTVSSENGIDYDQYFLLNILEKMKRKREEEEEMNRKSRRKR